jgi:Immunity protein 50
MADMGTRQPFPVPPFYRRSHLVTLQRAFSVLTLAYLVIGSYSRTAVLGTAQLLLSRATNSQMTATPNPLQPTPGSGSSSAARFTSLGPAWLSYILSLAAARIMSWYHQCVNPQAIDSLYSSAPPLERWELREVSILEDGPRVNLRADLSVFPDHPPQRWHSDFTVAQITISLIGISDLSVTGWAQNNAGVFTLLRESPDTLRFTFESDSTRLRGRCVIAHISKISGYATENA